MQIKALQPTEIALSYTIHKCLQLPRHLNNAITDQSSTLHMCSCPIGLWVKECANLHNYIQDALLSGK